MDRQLSKLFQLALLGLLLPSFLFSQEDPDPRYKIQVDAALYELRVRNRQGEHVSGLKKEDFIVTEGGIGRPIVFFNEETEEPLTLAILLDKGSGMSRKSMLKGKDLIFDLIHLLDARDSILLAAFAEEVDVLCKATSDRHALLESLANIYSESRPGRWSWGSPNVGGFQQAATLGISFSPSNSNTGYAIDRVLRQILESSHPAKAILVISAGFPNLGEATLDHLRSTGVSIFGVAMDYKLGRILDFGLNKMAKKVVDRTGGVLYSAKQVSEQVETLRDAMKSLYLLAYQRTAPQDIKGQPEVEFRLVKKSGYEIVPVRRIF